MSGQKEIISTPVFVLNFHSGVCTTTNFPFKRYFPSKIWKKPIGNVCYFFTTLAQMFPQEQPYFDFFAGFQWNILEDSININKFN